MARKKKSVEEAPAPLKVTLRRDQLKDVMEYFDKLRIFDPKGETQLVIEIDSMYVTITATRGDVFKLARHFYRRDYDYDR